MAAPAITPSTRFIHAGVTKIVFATTVSNINSPSRAEINAGTDLSNECADSAGWNVKSNIFDTPDYGRVFTGKLNGRTTSDDSSLTMYASTQGADARSLLPRGTNGFILWMDGGDVASNKMDVFPVRVASGEKV